MDGRTERLTQRKVAETALIAASCKIQ